jgi:predicted lipoprotein with Yx(FWY)xxD motif
MPAATRRCTRLMSWTVLPVVGMLLLAGCGSGSGDSTDPAAEGGSEIVATGTTKVGTVLVDRKGRTLYAFAADTKGHSNCDGSCATYWPPVKAVGALNRPDGVEAKLGTTKRSDGSVQLTVAGWPMYTYAGDSEPGQATGQGKDLSGGKWWVVAPSGRWIKKKADTSGGQMGY